MLQISRATDVVAAVLSFYIDFGPTCFYRRPHKHLAGFQSVAVVCVCCCSSFSLSLSLSLSLSCYLSQCFCLCSSLSPSSPLNASCLRRRSIRLLRPTTVCGCCTPGLLATTVRTPSICCKHVAADQKPTRRATSDLGAVILMIQTHEKP